jgi:putative transposase
MSNGSNIRHSKHYIFNLHMHWVFVAKYRRRVFDARAIDLLRGIFDNVCSDAHATLVQMDGEDYHVLRQQRPDIRKCYYKGVLWSPSYFASSCSGAPISIVRGYIEQQKTPN